MTYLFQAVIGPVQSFIASARRTRDLWFGSTLLSELAKTAARVIAENPENLLIFPAPTYKEELAPNTDLNVANKILARIANEPDALGAAIEIAIQSTLNSICERLFNDLPHNAQFNRQAARLQIEDLIDYSWVAIKEDDEETKRDALYYRTRQDLEGLLAARKNTRNYTPAIWQSSNAKSSIDGQLESVIEESLYPRSQQLSQEQARKKLDLFRQFRAGGAERLSGVDLLKRLGEFSDKQKQQRGDRALFSTSHIASLPYLQRLSQLYRESTPGTKVALEISWRAYMDHVRAIHLPDSAVTTRVSPSPVDEHIPQEKASHPILQDRDGALLYGERLIEDAATPNKLKQATQALQDFFKQVNTQANEHLAPTPYYAIIVADGDGMGKVLDHEAKNGLERHRAVSNALDRFSRHVKTLVEGEHGDQGSLIYAGGDDVLAFVPLHRVLPCAQALAVSFREELAMFTNAGGDSPTLSLGVAIVHHVSLLNEALAQARAAEKAAKRVPKKNALAIKLCKRGGETYTISGHWGNLDLYLARLIDSYRLNRIPKGLPYELRDSLLRLTALRDDDGAGKLIDVIKEDAKRILGRKLQVPQRKQHPETRVLLRLLSDRIGIAADERVEETQEPAKTAPSWLIDGLENTTDMKISTFFNVVETYIHEFVIAQELADVLNLAEGQPIVRQEEVRV